MLKKNKAGVLLAGGASRRFGSPKAFATRNGKPFYTYSLEALQPHTESQVIITSRALKEQFIKAVANLAIYTDVPGFAGKGPLAGIYTAMEREQAEWYVTAPVDVPFIHARVYELLLDYADEQTDAIIPVVSERMHPLIAVYHRAVKSEIEKNLVNGKLSVRELLENIRVKYVPMEDEQPFININRQEDFKNAKAEE